MEYSAAMTPRQSKAHTAANRRAIEIVRAAFARSHMTRQELAKESGIPDGSLAGLFAGTKPLYAEQLVGLAVALGLDVTELASEMDAARRAEAATDDLAVKRQRARTFPVEVDEAARNDED